MTNRADIDPILDDRTDLNYDPEGWAPDEFWELKEKKTIMATDPRRLELEYTLRQMVMVSLRAPQEEVDFGHPLSHLIEQALQYGMGYIVEYIVSHDHGEYRLNGAGLKLISRNFGGRIYLYVAGDQADRYPVTVPKLREIVEKNGFKENLGE